MQEIDNAGLRLPDDDALEAGEDSSEEALKGSDRSSWVPPRLEPTVQARANGRHARPCDIDGPVTAYPAEARGQFLWEVFEGPDDRLVDRDPASGLGSLRDGFHVEELVEEAEERAERFMAAQRQLAAAFFARRKNSLYRQAATAALHQPQQPEPKLLLLWNLLGDQGLDADTGTNEEVSRWLSGLSEEDFLFFTQDPDGDPQRVMGCGILPEDLRPMRLFAEQRRRLMRVLIRESAFFHPDDGMFETKLREKLPQIAGKWDLDEAVLLEMAREERVRYYRWHLAICRASAAFARGKAAPANVQPEVVAEVAAVAYGRMDHPSYKAQALSFGRLGADEATSIFARLDRFTEEFYASRLFSFLKRAMIRRRTKLAGRTSQSTAGIEPVVEAFVKGFRSDILPKGMDRGLVQQVAALALFETYYGGFRGHSAAHDRPRTRFRPQILSWGGFAGLDEAKRIYEAIPDREAIRRVLFPAIAQMAREERLRRAGALLENARDAYRALAMNTLELDELTELRSSIERLLGTFAKKEVSRVPVLAALNRSLQHLAR